MPTPLPSGPEARLTSDQKLMTPVKQVLTDAVNAGDLPKSYRDNARRGLRWSAELETLIGERQPDRGEIHTKIRNLVSVMHGIEGHRRDHGHALDADQIKAIATKLARRFREPTASYERPVSASDARHLARPGSRL